jgi:hypothetical protein
MPDDETFDDETDPQDEDALIVKLRTQAREGARAQAKAEALERELAVMKAGIPDTPLGQMFAKSYEGENTPEALRAAAVEIGLIEASTEDVAATDDRLANARVAQAAAGATSGPPNADYEADFAAAQTAEEIYAVQQKYRGWGSLEQ